jgi:hypothetical protein
MIPDYYSEAVKKRAKQDTPQDATQDKQRAIKDYTNNTRKPRQIATPAGNNTP